MTTERETEVIAEDDSEVAPFTIDEVLQLFDDLSLETYYGKNLRQFMMGNNDKFLHELRDFVDRAHQFRESPSL